MIDALIPGRDASSPHSPKVRASRTPQAIGRRRRAGHAGHDPAGCTEGPRELPRRAKRGAPGSRSHLISPASSRPRPKPGAGRSRRGDIGARRTNGAIRSSSGPGSDQHSASWCSTTAGRLSRSTRRSTSRSTRSRAGSSTTRTRSGQRTQEVIKAGLDKVKASDIAAVGVTNQRETTVVWDRNERAAGLQRDRLAGHPHRHDLQRAVGRRRPGPLPAKIGLPIATYFSGPKINVDPRERRRNPREGGGAAT